MKANVFPRRRAGLLFILLLCNVVFKSCNDAPLEKMEAKGEPYFVNNKLQATGGKLKILAIGNSYTDDGTAYIAEIARGLSIPDSCYCVYSLTEGSSSLDFWYEELISNNTVNIKHQAGSNTLTASKGTVADVLEQEWDVIVLQQFSNLAIDYTSYNPSLRCLIDTIRSKCKNPGVAIAWQLVPAYGKDSPNNKKLYGDERWKRIATATQTMVALDGIDIVIPTGTAIQIARHGTLENEMDLTRDNTHLCYGVGRYIAACTWTKTLLCPVFNYNIRDCKATHEITRQESEDQDEEFVPASSIPVTDDNRDDCIKCVVEACQHPFSLE